MLSTMRSYLSPPVYIPLSFLSCHSSVRTGRVRSTQNHTFHWRTEFILREYRIRLKLYAGLPPEAAIEGWWVDWKASVTTEDMWLKGGDAYILYERGNTPPWLTHILRECVTWIGYNLSRIFFQFYHLKFVIYDIWGCKDTFYCTMVVFYCMILIV